MRSRAIVIRAIGYNDRVMTRIANVPLTIENNLFAICLTFLSMHMSEDHIRMCFIKQLLFITFRLRNYYRVPRRRATIIDGPVYSHQQVVALNRSKIIQLIAGLHVRVSSMQVDVCIKALNQPSNCTCGDA
jgi:hypothetical protein